MRVADSLRSWLLIGALGCAPLAANVSGCGGDSSATASSSDGGTDATSDTSSSGGDDGSADTSSSSGSGSGSSSGSGSGSGSSSGSGSGSGSSSGAPDSGTDAGNDAAADAGGDAGSDATTGCGADGTACSDNGSAGLCKSNVCSPCTDPSDDSSCTTAYGSASMPYLCLAGVCTPGDCRTNADCANNANGGLCGVSTPNFCGKCTSDTQCASANPATPICNTTSGQCVTGTCTSNMGEPPAACPVNAADICCKNTCQPAAGADACCSTDPTSNAYCSGKLGMAATCTNNTCTACPAVTNFQYTVDPVNGSDQTGTGASTAGCAFKTITRALQVLGSNPPVPASITVLGPSTVGPGESFPILLPKNVTLTTSQGAVTIDVPAGKAGFGLAQPNTNIAGGSGAALTISGQANTATFGIVVNTGSALTTTLSNLTVSSFLDDGILVENSGIVSIGAGVTSTANGTATARKAGLHVTGTGVAVISVPSGSTPTHFDGNTNHGILVDSGGSIQLAGSVIDGSTGKGTVTTNDNYAAGIWIEQSATTPTQNVISGLVAYANTNGNGLRFVAGSNVTLRNSASLANQGSGVVVSSRGGTNPSNDISKIDLGNEKGNQWGGNTLQAALGSANNGAAGICLATSANAGTLLGAGDVFAGTDCATTAGTLTINKAGCGNAACTGGVCDLGIVKTAGNDIDVSMCTHP